MDAHPIVILARAIMQLCVDIVDMFRDPAYYINRLGRLIINIWEGNEIH